MQKHLVCQSPFSRRYLLSLILNQLVPESAKVYLTAVGYNECIISGDPQRLTQLWRHSVFLRNSRGQDVPSIGHWHAPHLYRREQVTRILDPFIKSLEELGPPHRTMLSSGTGKVIECQSPRSLFELALVDLPGKSIQLDKLQQTIHDFISDQQPKPTSLLTFQTSWDPLRIESTTSTEAPELQDLSKWCFFPHAEPKGQHKSSNIAIVGMSCRLPGADDTEELLGTLTAGSRHAQTNSKGPLQRRDPL